MTATEAALQALVAALEAQRLTPGSVLPEVARNRVADDVLRSTGTPGLMCHLNVVDGDGQATRFAWAAGEPAFELQHRATIEWAVGADRDADREPRFDAGLEEIATAVAALSAAVGVTAPATLKGVGLDEAPERGLDVTDGGLPVKFAIIPVRLTIHATTPF